MVDGRPLHVNNARDPLEGMPKMVVEWVDGILLPTDAFLHYVRPWLFKS